jgi:hypothetical protein
VGTRCGEGVCPIIALRLLNIFCPYGSHLYPKYAVSTPNFVVCTDRKNIQNKHHVAPCDVYHGFGSLLPTFQIFSLCPIGINYEANGLLCHLATRDRLHSEARPPTSPAGNQTLQTDTKWSQQPTDLEYFSPPYGKNVSVRSQITINRTLPYIHIDYYPITATHSYTPPQPPPNPTCPTPPHPWGWGWWGGV